MVKLKSVSVAGVNLPSDRVFGRIEKVRRRGWKNAGYLIFSVWAYFRKKTAAYPRRQRQASHTAKVMSRACAAEPDGEHSQDTSETKEAAARRAQMQADGR